MIDRVYFIFPQNSDLDFDMSMIVFEQFCEFVHNKYPDIQGMRQIIYKFDTKRLCCEKWMGENNKSLFLECWTEFKSKYGKVDELING